MHAKASPTQTSQAADQPARSDRTTSRAHAHGRDRRLPVLRIARRAIVDVALVAAVGAFLFLGVGPHVIGYRTVTMLSGSMSPHIRPGDVVIDTKEPLSAIRVGQILTIHTPTSTHYVDSHRVIQVIRRGQKTLIRTKGDANASPDPWTAVVHGTVVWRVRAVVPWLGFAITFLRSSLMHVLLLMIAPVLLIVYGLAAIWRRSPTPSTDTEG